MTDSWTRVVLEKQRSRKVGEPIASVVNGMITFNSTACNLIDDIYDYEWVEVLESMQEGRAAKLAFKFTNKKDEYVLHATRKNHKGKALDAISVHSRQLVKRYFGELRKVSRYRVSKTNDKTLVIDILSEI